jgi:hypothetical protein
MMMRRALILGLGVAMVAGACNRIDIRSPIQRGSGAETRLPHQASLRAERDGQLTVTVRAEGAGLAEVRESARYPVTRHCIDRHGASAADWEVDPATGDWAFARDSAGNMVLRTRCRT